MWQTHTQTPTTFYRIQILTFLIWTLRHLKFWDKPLISVSSVTSHSDSLSKCNENEIKVYPANFPSGLNRCKKFLQRGEIYYLKAERVYKMTQLTEHSDRHLNFFCFVVGFIFFRKCPDKSGQEVMSGIDLAHWNKILILSMNWLQIFYWPVYQSGPRSTRLNTVLTRRRHPISVSVLTYLLLCSSTDTSSWSQSRYTVGMFEQVITWMTFWNLSPPSRNSFEVSILTIPIVSIWKRNMPTKATRVHFAVRAV